MFQERKTSLMEVPVAVKTATKGTNSFVQAGLKNAAVTRSGNNALKYTNTGNDFVSQFGSLGQYMTQRSFADISRDMSILHAQDRVTAIRFTLYMRLISRRCKMFDGTVTENVQRGAGLKHESIMRMIWLAINDKKGFFDNIQLFVSCGSWKDIFEMMRYDLEFHGFENKVLNWDILGKLIQAGLSNTETSELVKKYLPQITARSKAVTLRKQANTIIGKYLANSIFGKNSYKAYRKLKSGGTAHEWQQLISKGLFNEIDFDSIHGRALAGLAGSKFLANQGLEVRYTEWIESKPIAKFTGYVHELGAKIDKAVTQYQKLTIDKQYDGLIQLAKDNVNTKSGLIVVRDTSGSMGSTAQGTTMASGDIAKALGIFFGDMLEGYFASSWIEFNNVAKMHTYKTKNFTDKWNEHRGGYVGGTNFQAVVQLFGNLKAQGVPEEDFPTGIICISDGEFNPAQLGKTNVQSARSFLIESGFSEEYVKNFQIILWNIPNSYYIDSTTKFETFGETENVYYLSGYDASIISFLLGGNAEGATAPKTDVELFESAMNQEILMLVS